jgi:hypothetical protein
VKPRTAASRADIPTTPSTTRSSIVNGMSFVVPCHNRFAHVIYCAAPEAYNQSD